MLVNFEFRHNNDLVCATIADVDFEEQKRLFDVKMQHSSPCEIYISNKQIIEGFSDDKSLFSLIEQLLIPSLLGNLPWESYHKGLRKPLEPVNIAVDYITFSGFKEPIYRLSCNEDVAPSMVLKLCDSYLDDICKGSKDDIKSESQRSFTLNVTFIDESESKTLCKSVNMADINIQSLGIYGLDNESMVQILETTNITEVIKDQSTVVNSLFRVACDISDESEYTSIVAGFYAFNKCLQAYDNANPEVISVVLRKVENDFGIEISVE